MGGRGASSGVGVSKATASNEPKWELASHAVDMETKEKITGGNLSAKDVPKSSRDTEWHKPNSKMNSRPIYYSTKATSDAVSIMAQDNKGLTIKQLYERDPGFNPDVWKVLRVYINKGYGDYVASDLFRYSTNKMK